VNSTKTRINQKSKKPITYQELISKKVLCSDKFRIFTSIRRFYKATNVMWLLITNQNKSRF